MRYPYLLGDRSLKILLKRAKTVAQTSSVQSAPAAKPEASYYF